MIYGSPGSGKSSLAAYLVMLRYYLKNHTIEIVDPRLEMNRLDAWKDLISINIACYGDKYDYGAINDRMAAFNTRLEASPDKKWHTAIFDEVTKYGTQPETKELATTLIPSCLVDARGAKESPILIAHGNTSTLLGNAEGYHQARQDGLAQICLFSGSNNGGYYPAYRGFITGIPDQEGNYKRDITIIPELMNTEYLTKVFQPGSKPNTPLGEPLVTVLEFAKRQGDFVKAAQVQRGNANLVDPETGRKISTKKIRSYFGLLADFGYGELNGEGDRLRFRAY